MVKEQPTVINESPSPVQVRNAESMGWVHIGEGIFAKDNPSGDEWMGYYSNNGFKVES